MKIQLSHKFEEIISVENLLTAWQEFVRGKRSKPDVQGFSLKLLDNILDLHSDLASKTYRHGEYYCFNISDPKPRNISKALVRDRLVHHAVYRILYPFFDKVFITDSFSCRSNKGTHKAVKRLQKMFFKVSRNNTRTCWVLKLDIKKFFASIDHKILKRILAKYISDKDVLWLLENIIDSFSSVPGKGLPLGNLTSQLFVNVFMNQFDQYVKHKLKARYYIRYADDFLILSSRKENFVVILPVIKVFLKQRLGLLLHPNKIVYKSFVSGIDFLGWVSFANHRVLRTSTKRRMFRKINKKNLQSYSGLLKHGNTFKLRLAFRT